MVKVSDGWAREIDSGESPDDTVVLMAPMDLCAARSGDLSVVSHSLGKVARFLGIEMLSVKW